MAGIETVSAPKITGKRGWQLVIVPLYALGTTGGYLFSTIENSLMVYIVIALVFLILASTAIQSRYNGSFLLSIIFSFAITAGIVTGVYLHDLSWMLGPNGKGIQVLPLTSIIFALGLPLGLLGHILGLEGDFY